MNQGIGPKKEHCAVKHGCCLDISRTNVELQSFRSAKESTVPVINYFFEFVNVLWIAVNHVAFLTNFHMY